MRERQVNRLKKIYACLMTLYPRSYRDEFAEERQEVFAQALEEAAHRRDQALFQLVICELRDFPASVIRENFHAWEAMMKRIETGLREEGFSWIGLVLGIWPFLLFGPLLAILPYLPKQYLSLFVNQTFYRPIWLGIAFLSLLIGIYAGWRKGFPRWSYPYLVILLFAILFPLLNQIGLLLGQLDRRLNPLISFAIFLFSILGLGAGILFLLSRIPKTRKIYTDIRADWTRVSFGMIVFLAFGTGFFWGDRLPPFGLGVVLPSLVVLLGAIAYLLSRRLLIRSIVLILTITITMVRGVTLPAEERWAGLFVLFFVAILLSPALIGLVPRPQVPHIDEVSR